MTLVAAGLGWRWVRSSGKASRFAVRSGGYAIAAGLMVAGIFSREVAVLLMAVAPAALISAADDIRPVKVRYRLMVHVLTGVVVAWMALGWASESSPATGFVFLLAIVWVVGYMNSFNFMDGIDGMAGLHAVIVALTYAVIIGGRDPVVTLLASSIAAVALAYLPWNIAPGRLTMGDLGSITLGALIAVVFLKAFQMGESPARLLLPMLPYLLDTSITLARRLIRGERFHESHEMHFYQRMRRAGLSTIQVDAIWALLAIIGGLLAVAWPSMSGAQHVLLWIGLLSVNGIVLRSVSVLERRRPLS